MVVVELDVLRTDLALQKITIQAYSERNSVIQTPKFCRGQTRLSVFMTGGTVHDEGGRSKQKYDQAKASNYRSIVVKQGEAPIRSSK
jgi:hypothetical protein